MLHYLGVPFTDETVPLAEVRGRKPDFPMLQLPVMKVAEGDREVTLWQTPAIVRYVCSHCPEGKPNPYPVATDPLGAALADAVFHSAEELVGFNPVVNWFQEGSEIQQARCKELMTVLQAKLPLFAKMHLQTDGPFFGGAAPNIGDFHMFHVLDHAVALDPAACSAWDGFQGWYGAMKEVGGFKEYLAERPKGGSRAVGNEGSFLWNTVGI